MNLSRLCLAVTATLILSSTLARGDDVPVVADVPVASFTDQLAPYGGWIDVPIFGRVWQPDPNVVGLDFRPYASNGHWVYTAAGWTFASNFDWGWATFHYGRWVWLTNYRWVWVPGSSWAPAWVDWRFNGEYVGWFPMTAAGYTGPEYLEGWTFVPAQHLTSSAPYAHAVDIATVRQLHGSTLAQPASGSYARGPTVASIAHATGTAVPVTPLAQTGALPKASASAMAKPAASAPPAATVAPQKAARVITIEANPTFDKQASHNAHPASGNAKATGTVATSRGGGTLTIPPASSAPAASHPAAHSNRPFGAGSGYTSGGGSANANYYQHGGPTSSSSGAYSYGHGSGGGSAEAGEAHGARASVGMVEPSGHTGGTAAHPAVVRKR